MRTGRHPLSRSTLWLAGVLVPIGIAAAVAMVLLWPSGQRGATPDFVEQNVSYPTARVTASHTETCQGSVEDRLPDGTIPESVQCLNVTAVVTSGPSTGTTVKVVASAMTDPTQLGPGTRIIVERYPATATDEEFWAWHDFSRSVPLGVLAIGFGLVTVAVARMRGLRALVGLVIAFAVIGAFIMPGLLAGTDPLWLGLTGSVVIMFAVLYLAHGVSRRSSVALLGTLAGLGVTALLGVVAARAAHVSGISSEDGYHLARLLGADGAAQLRGIFLCGVVLAGLGVLNDVTITQASAVWELKESAPEAGPRELYRRGMRIGRDHIASTVYTIAFAYAGAALPVLLLLQIYRLPVAQTLMSGTFAEEIVRTLVGSIGLVLAIPLTTMIAAAIVSADQGPGRRRHRQPEQTGHSHSHD